MAVNLFPFYIVSYILKTIRIRTYVGLVPMLHTTRILVFSMDQIWLVAWVYPCYNPQKHQLHELPLQQPPLQQLNYRLVAWVIHAITSGTIVATVCPCNKDPCNK